MSNPYLPNWEYIPDGEPRVFGNRVYVYGSHDRVASDRFCDYKIKVWSAPLDNLDKWTCHGDAFHTRADRDHGTDTYWTDNELYAPDVVEKDGKYYLYAYILGAKGCVAVSEKPEGPFKLLSTYKYNVPQGRTEEYCNNGIFIDPGVLVDDDGRVYIYCGYLRSFMAELNPANMYEVIDGSYKDDIIPVEEPHKFFEACSPRKIGGTYYMIYSPKPGSRLVYATSKSPAGPFEYRGIIVDNAIDYPGGNNHGSICKIKDRWYVFYHRMTNGTIMSRRGCVEPIEILQDGTIPQVEMTSLGFEESLSPYEVTPAEIACVLKGGCFITEINVFTRVITNITDSCVIGFKYFDFGDDYSGTSMKFFANIKGAGSQSKIGIYIDNTDDENNKIGECEIGINDGTYSTIVKNVTGRHALYFVAREKAEGAFLGMFKNRRLFDLMSVIFIK